MIFNTIIKIIILLFICINIINCIDINDQVKVNNDGDHHHSTTTTKVVDVVLESNNNNNNNGFDKINNKLDDNTIDKLKQFKKRYHILQMSSNHSLVSHELQSRGWVQSKNNGFCSFKWGWNWDVLGVSSERMIVNHFPNFDEIGSKRGLTENMNNLIKISNQQTKDTINHFFPRSYSLYKPLEKQSFIKDFERMKRLNENNNNNNKNIQQQQFNYNNNNEELLHSISSTYKKQKEEVEGVKDKEVKVVEQEEEGVKDLQPWIDGKKNIWIVKPSSQARGVGIKLFNNLTELLKYSQEDDDDFVVQKYVEAPLTVHGRKFDIRQFVLVKSLNPLTIFLYRDCYLRFCSIEYTTDNLNDKFIHLSNHQIQKEYEGHDENDEMFPQNQWPLSKFKQYLNQHHSSSISNSITTDGENVDVWDTIIYEKIKKLVINTIESWPKEGHRNNSFELLGFDILLSDGLEPLLLEVNTNPGLHLLTDTVKVHHANAVRDMFKIVIDLHDCWTANPSFPNYILNLADESTQLFGDWQLVHLGTCNSSIIPMKPKSTKSSGAFVITRNHDQK